MGTYFTQIYWKSNHMKPEENILTCPPSLLTLNFSIDNKSLEQFSGANKPLVGNDEGNVCSRAYSRCTLRKPATLRTTLTSTNIVNAKIVVFVNKNVRDHANEHQDEMSNCPKKKTSISFFHY